MTVLLMGARETFHDALAWREQYRFLREAAHQCGTIRREQQASPWRKIGETLHKKGSPMRTEEVLETMARSMVAAGLYKDIAAALRAMALEQIERKIATYRAQVEAFEQKYQHSLETHSGLLVGRASMAEEEEWMEWKGAVVMLEAWRRALQEVLKNVGAAGH